MIKIKYEKGSILSDTHSGKVIAIIGSWTNGDEPNCFMIDEYCSHYRVSNLPSEIDIRDIAYERDNGELQPACAEYRRLKAQEAMRGDQK